MEIKGRYYTGTDDDLFGALGQPPPVPKFCEKCGAEFPWADKLDDDPVTNLAPTTSLERICKRIPLVIRQLRHRHETERRTTCRMNMTSRISFIRYCSSFSMTCGQRN